MTASPRKTSLFRCETTRKLLGGRASPEDTKFTRAKAKRKKRWCILARRVCKEKSLADGHRVARLKLELYLAVEAYPFLDQGRDARP